MSYFKSMSFKHNQKGEIVEEKSNFIWLSLSVEETSKFKHHHASFVRQLMFKNRSCKMQVLRLTNETTLCSILLLW